MEALKMIPKPSVSSYQDYLSFLRDYIDYRKTLNPKASLRSIAQQAGISPSLLAMGLSGKRRMTERVFTKLIVALELTKVERQILKLLRTIAESEVPIERVEALEELQKIPDYIKSNKNALSVFKYLANWINVAVREMLMLPDFKEDLNWIQGRLRGAASIKEIQSSLEFLKNNGHVEYDSTGQLRVKTQHLECSEGVFKISLGQFHRQMLDLAEKSIDDVERDLRLLLGHTFALDHKKIPEIKNILNEALKKIEGLQGSSENALNLSEVYHVEIAMFPLTQSENQEEESYE